MMHIRQTTYEDIEALMQIFAHARAQMAADGNPNQWGAAPYPTREVLEEDIKQGVSYVLEHEGKVCATFVFIMGDDPTYALIEDGEWLNPLPYGTIHRIASDGKQQGVFQAALQWCSARCPNIRIDTHADNSRMLHLIEKAGFTRCGIIYTRDHSPRVAYQKIYPTTTPYMLLVIQGEADINYNTTAYHLTERMVLFGQYSHELAVVRKSKDLKYHIITNTNPQMDSSLYAALQIEKDWHKKVQFIHTHPVLTIPEEVLQHIKQYVDILLTHSDTSNIYHQRIQYMMKQSVLFEIFAWIDMEMQQQPPQRLELDQSTDRKQQLLLEFMRILQANKGTERNVGWYAEQMCITVKYLQAICRTTVNASPTDLINQMALNEIKHLLTDTNMTIKEVAMQMCFASASSFCKYFHRLTGMSALSYREQR